MKYLIRKTLSKAVTAGFCVWAVNKITQAISKHSAPTASEAPKIADAEKKAEFELKDQMEYAVGHFNTVAEQRLKMFNFYVIITAAVLTATATIFSRSQSSEADIQTIMGYAGWANLGLAVIFAIVEARNMRLIHVAQVGIYAIESKPEWPEYLRLALLDSQEQRRPKRWWTRKQSIISFRSAFNATYGLHILIGVVLIYSNSRKVDAFWESWRRATQSAQKDANPCGQTEDPQSFTYYFDNNSYRNRNGSKQ